MQARANYVGYNVDEGENDKQATSAAMYELTSRVCYSRGYMSIESTRRTRKANTSGKSRSCLIGAGCIRRRAGSAAATCPRDHRERGQTAVEDHRSFH